jgi:hypothetical protein
MTLASAAICALATFAPVNMVTQTEIHNVGFFAFIGAPFASDDRQYEPERTLGWTLIDNF